MDQEGDQSTDKLDMDDASKERKSRSACLISKKWDNVKRVIEFDGRGVMIGRITRNKVSNWQGTIARTQVSLTNWKKWSNVPKEIKDDLWKNFQVSAFLFVINFSFIFVDI